MRGQQHRGKHAQLLHEADRTCCRCGQLRILEVGVLRVRPKGDGKCLREHPKHTNTPNQIAVLEVACALRDKVVRMQTTSDATPYHFSMYSTHHRVK
jgi:hypothetical protein